MSGLIIGMLDALCISSLFLPLKLLIPIAAAVPSTVAKIDASTAIISELPRAFIILSSLKSSSYHLNEKPFHTVVLPSLNENIMSTKIGRYKNNITSVVYIFEAICLFFIMQSPPHLQRNS